MALERQLHYRKMTAWLNLLAGLLWLSIPLRNVYFPHFPSVARLSNPRASIAPVQVVTGIIWLVVAWKNFSSVRRNPEGKTEPAIQTLFGDAGKST
jgi:hypothetical protein